jgi:hypothetical protein
VANFFKPAIVNNLVAGLTAVAFTTAIISPLQIHGADVNLDFGAINFGVKVEKVFEKIKRSIDKGETNKIIGYMFDIKTEVEQYTGKKIDINKQIDQAQKEAKAKGQKIEDRCLKEIKKEFHRLDKKQKHRAEWFAQCAQMDIPYSSFEADLNFDMNFVAAKSAKGQDTVVEVPIPVMVGVTVSLCGLFLAFVPLPGCQVAGIWLINAGVGILAGEAIHKWDQYDREQKGK